MGRHAVFPTGKKSFVNKGALYHLLKLHFAKKEILTYHRYCQLTIKPN